MTRNSTEPAISLRPARETDEALLAAVYASSRAQELSVVDWSESQKAEFLRMQFTLQHRYYHEHYTHTSWDVIMAGDVPVGRLYVARWPEEIRIVDISLLPEHRGRGIGSSLIGQVIGEAERAGKPVRIHVEQYNPAMRLYERLGFRPVGHHGVYVLMQRDCPAPATPVS